MYLINDTIIGLAKQELRGLNLSISAAVQPITEAHLTAAQEAGGDPLDLDPADGSFISKFNPCLVFWSLCYRDISWIYI